jgi:glucan 1,3-beta-glucosidase
LTRRTSSWDSSRRRQRKHPHYPPPCTPLTQPRYYQPNPDATIPFPEDKALSDPVFTPTPAAAPYSSNSTTNGTAPSVNNAEGWALRILRSSSIHGYGVGLYSFFNNYNTSCSDITSEGICQTRILSIEGGSLSHDINIYNLNTVGATQMLTRDGVDLIANVDNNSTFVDTVNMFRI